MASNAGAIRAGRAFVELYADDSKLTRNLRAAGDKIKTWGATVTKAGLASMAAGTAILGPMLAATKQFATAGDEVNKMADRTGLAVENLSRLRYAAEISDASFDDLGKAVQRMHRLLAEAEQGSDKAVRALAALGFTVDELRALSPDEQFATLARRLADVSDPGTKAALAMELFGRSGTALLPMLAAGSKGFDDLIDRADRLGFTMDEETTDAATVLGDTMAELVGTVKAASIQVGAALAPALTSVLESMREVVAPAVQWIKENRELIVTIAKIGAGLVVAGGAAVAFGTVISSIGSIIGGAAAATKAFGVALTFLAAHPVVAVLAGVTALAAAYYVLTRATQQADKAMNDYYSRQSAVRSEDRARFAELEKLAGQQSLNSEEMGRANEIISTLETRYGALGISIDAATGKISGMTEAQRGFNDQIRQQQLNEMEMQLRDVNRQLEKAEEAAAMHATRESPFSPAAWARAWRGPEGEQDDYAEVERLGDLQRNLRKQMDVLRAGGDVPEDAREAGGAAGEAFVGGLVEAIDANQSLLDEITRLSIESIEDPFVRALAQIDQQYTEQMARAKEAGQDLALVEAARAQAIDNAIAAEERRQALEREGEAERQKAEQQRQQDIEDAIRDRIEFLNIELVPQITIEGTPDDSFA